MKMVKEWQLKRLREEYPAGTRMELIHMDNPYNSKLGSGCQGTVRWVDDVGTTHISWDYSSSLGRISSEDAFNNALNEEASHQVSKTIWEVSLVWIFLISNAHL